MQLKNNADVEYRKLIKSELLQDTLIFQTTNGICATILLLIRHLCNLKLEKKYPKKIITILVKYKRYDLYKSIFSINLDALKKWEKYSDDEVKFFLNNMDLYPCVFTGKKKNYNFKMLSTIIDTYFVLNTNFLSFLSNLKNDIDMNEEIFLWWRKTDKKKEFDFFQKEYPSFSEAIKYLEDKNTLLQTDDFYIFKEAEQFKNIKILNIELKDSTNSGLHNRPEVYVSPEFHIKRIISLCYIASKFKKFIGYPGCVSFFILLLRKSFNNSIIFIEKDKIID